MKKKDKNTILEDYKRYLTLKGVRTAKDYISGVNEFIDYLGGGGEGFLFVNEKDAEDYRHHLLTSNRHLAHSTINGKLNHLRSFYRFLEKKGLVYQSPLYYVKGLKTGKGLPKNVLSVEEMGKLLDNFAIIRKTDIMTHSLAELLYGSAMRVGEAEALKESDVDFDTAVITITDFKNGGLRWKSPTSEASIRALKKYVKTVRNELTSEKDRADGFLFPQQGKTAVRCLLNAKLKRECKRHGLKTITSHSFRASAATHLLRSGAGIREIQAFLGHQKIGTTEVYTRVVKEDLKAVIETCHPRERRE